MDRDDVLAAIFTIVGVVATILFIPAISFAICWIGGWITKLVIGNTLANALNILFQSHYFTKEMIPMMSGALGWIGGFFKVKGFRSHKD